MPDIRFCALNQSRQPDRLLEVKYALAGSPRLESTQVPKSSDQHVSKLGPDNRALLECGYRRWRHIHNDAVHSISFKLAQRIFYLCGYLLWARTTRPTPNSLFRRLCAVQMVGCYCRGNTTGTHVAAMAKWRANRFCHSLLWGH